MKSSYVLDCRDEDAWKLGDRNLPVVQVGRFCLSRERAPTKGRTHLHTTYCTIRLLQALV